MLRSPSMQNLKNKFVVLSPGQKRQMPRSGSVNSAQIQDFDFFLRFDFFPGQFIMNLFSRFFPMVDLDIIYIL